MMSEVSVPQALAAEQKPFGTSARNNIRADKDYMMTPYDDHEMLLGHGTWLTLAVLWMLIETFE